jgi:hypothetical protein
MFYLRILLLSCAAATFSLFSLGAYAATTDLAFSGGCPSSVNKDLCARGSNADVDNVAALLGVDPSLVTEMGELTSDGSSNGFSVSGIGSLDDTWSVSDDSITHLAFKSSTYFILGEVQAKSGTWDNSDVGEGNGFGWNIKLVDCPALLCGSERAYSGDDFKNKGGNFADLSNVRAFSVVPVPAAVWLFGSGLIGLIAISRRCGAA